MSDMMTFPKRWEDFLHDYEFEDARRIYINGSRLIPSFRVEQMMEHYATVRRGHWNTINQITTGLPWKYRCSDCGCPQEYTHNYFPNCGARIA